MVEWWNTLEAYKEGAAACGYFSTGRLHSQLGHVPVSEWRAKKGNSETQEGS